MEKTRLPVVGSTAASTAFCSATIVGPGPDGSTLRLHFDGNGKVTAGNGSLNEPRPNALSTTHVATCPGSTPTCRTACYVENLKTAQGEIYALYEENERTLRTIVDDPSLAEAWVFLVAAWIREHARGGFRWHVSGDVFSLDHAEWIRDVCLEVGPEIRLWIYTRSFEYLAPLAEVATVRGGNLAVNLSCDRDNFSEAAWASVKYGARGGVYLRLCYLVVEGDSIPALGSDDVIFPDYSLRPRQHKTFQESPWWQSISQRERGLVCPADAVGKSEKIRCGVEGQGLCSRCTQ